MTHEQPLWVESFQGAPDLEPTALNEINLLHAEEFGPIYQANMSGQDSLVEIYLGQDADILEKAYKDPSVDHVLLKEVDTNIIVGFTSAGQAHPMSSDILKTERYALGLSPIRHANLHENTVTVGTTMIHSHFRRRGGWALMMDELDERIAERGTYVSMTRFVRTEGGYADKVQARYAHRLLFKKNVKTILGPQVYMRFALPL